MREKRYTLLEAKLELNREECKMRGHDYNIVEAMGMQGPALILCQRCGEQWSIERSKCES